MDVRISGKIKNEIILLTKKRNEYLIGEDRLKWSHKWNKNKTEKKNQKQKIFACDKNFHQRNFYLTSFV